MGKTILPFSLVLDERKQEYSKFRRALRAEDQHAFDALFEQARLHIQAAVYFGDPDPAEALFLAMMIENWKLVEGLERRLDELEAKIQALESANENTAA
jgi:hypothetical protein